MRLAPGVACVVLSSPAPSWQVVRPAPDSLTLLSSCTASVRAVVGRCSFRRYGLGLALLAATGIAVAATQSGRRSMSNALTVLQQAQPGLLLVASLAFACALVSSAAAWQVGLRACGGRARFVQVSARYAVGSVVNTVAPAHLGGAVRLGLLSRVLTGGDRIWRAGGIGASVAAARSLGLAIVIVAAAPAGGFPVWPAPLLGVGVVSVVFVCVRLSRSAVGRRGSVLEVFRMCARSPRAASVLVAWIGCSIAVRLVAASFVAVALGVSRPVSVALVLLAAFAVSGVVPLTPGNFGAGPGAAALALHGAGVSVGSSLALGLAFQAAETYSALVLGVAGAAVLADPGTRARRWSFAVAGAAAVLVAGMVGVASVDLV